jgi:hypothetical protein
MSWSARFFVRATYVDRSSIRSRGADLFLDAGAAEDLHRSRRDAAKFVLDGRPRMALDDDAGNAPPGEEHRHSQAVEAAAADENGGA